MARTHGRMFCTVWEDDDFLALSPEAKNVYQSLVSQKDLSHAGTIFLRSPLWAELIGYSIEVLEAALEELRLARFVVIDRRTFEVLVRSLIRRDGVYKQPNVYKSAIEHIYMVSSRSIRAALLAELTRLDVSPMNAEIRKVHEDVVEWLRANSGGPPSNPSRKGSPNPSGNPSPNPDCPDSENWVSGGSLTEGVSETRQFSMIVGGLADSTEPPAQGEESKGSANPSGKGFPPRADSPYPFPLTKEEPSSSLTASSPTDDQPTSKPDRKPKSAAKPKSATEPRADVEALCSRLFEMMTARGCRTTPITDAWRTEARLLLDKDGVHPQFAMDVLEWSQKHHFWKTNILSMPKFRKQWNTLYQQAEAACGPHPNNGRTSEPAEAEVVSFGGNNVIQMPKQRPSTTDQRVAQARAAGLELAAELRAMGVTS
jgi:hypothetical protein